MSRSIRESCLWVCDLVPLSGELTEAPASGEPKWPVLAGADLGFRELPRAAANPAIMRAVHGLGESGGRRIAANAERHHD
jgi:hypothetical protein